MSAPQVVPRNPLMTAHGPQTAGGAVVDAAAAADGSGLTPAVVLLAFTADAGGLVTVDVRPGTSALGCGATEATLRFWDAAAGGAVAGASQPYALNTTADAPHGTGLVSGLACHPSLPLAVTTGREGEFKVWARAGGAPRKAGGSGAAGASHWRCAAVGGYKGLPLTCCAFSQDGSLLAVGAGPSATLWDPTSTSLLSLLCCPAELLAAGHELRQLAFMRASPHLLAVYGGGDPSAAAAASAPGAGGGSDLQQQQQQQQGLGPRRRLLNGVRGCYGNALVVWNLLTQAVSWYASMPVCALAADPVHDVFAVGVPALMDAPRASTGGSNGGSSNGASGQQQAAAASPQQQAGSGAQQELAKQKPRQRQAAQQGLVLVFGPHSPDPLYACPVLGSNPSTLLFSPGSTQAAAAAAAAGGAEQPPAPPSVSPLLLLTDDRRYTRLVLAAAAAGGADAAAAAAAAGESSGVPAGAGAALEAEAAAAGSDGGASGLEAMFGKAAPAAVRGSGGGGSGCGDRDGAAEAAAIKAAVAQLFDAPSHVLPPPSALCPTLLELLTGAAAGARLQQQR
jgi:NET1-associated nuclear protein 1 (U3 small nucleolar RNA-associated protein 17)